jgi:hypothetical protein
MQDRGARHRSMLHRSELAQKNPAENEVACTGHCKESRQKPEAIMMRLFHRINTWKWDSTDGGTTNKALTKTSALSWAAR